MIEYLSSAWAPIVVIVVGVGYIAFTMLKRKKGLFKKKPPADITVALKEKGFGEGDNPESIAIRAGESFREWESRLHKELLSIGEAIKQCEKDMAWRKQVHTRLKEDEWRIKQMLVMLRKTPTQSHQ